MTIITLRTFSWAFLSFYQSFGSILTKLPRTVYLLILTKLRRTVLVIDAAVDDQKQGEPSKFLKIIQPLEKTEVGIHSKNLLDTIDGFNGSTGETKTVFSGFAPNSGKKNFFQWKFWEKLV